MSNKKETPKKFRASTLDNMIGIFSPRVRRKRLLDKFASSIMERKYEGAGKGRRTKGWFTRSTSASAEVAIAGATLRDRSRDLVRNNPYAKRGVEGITNNTVGRGTMIQWKTKPTRLENDINARWRAWANTPSVCDFDGLLTYGGMESLAFRSMIEGGESLAVLKRVERQSAIDPVSGKLVEVPPIQIQILEGDFIASNRQTGVQSDGTRIIQGIVFDQDGKRISYKLFKQHPGSFNVTPISSSLAFDVPASEVAHIYRLERAGQIRGVPWAASIIIKLRDLDEFSDANLVRQKIAAMWVAFVKDNDSLEEALTEVEKEELGEKMEPGVIEFLPPGKDISFAKPPGVENYDEFMSVELHAIASGLGCTFEMLTGNLKGVNFSSGRMGFLEFQRNVDTWRAHIMRPMFLTRTTQWWLEGLLLLGLKTNDVRRVFTPPRREMIDPTKEVPANKTAVRTGFKSLSEVIRESGKDPEEHFAELKSDTEMLDKLGLILDSDPRNTQISGIQQNDEPTPPPTSDDDD